MDAKKEQAKVKRKEIHKTKAGLLSRIYDTQKKSSKRRGHPLPAYTKKDFIENIIDTSLFNRLHKQWIDSNCDKNLIPSIDRLKDNKPYTIDNIQLTTWGENNEKAYRDRENGNSTKCKPIIQLSLDDKPIKEFKSIAIAARELGFHESGISGVCTGLYQTTKGYKFKFI